jgi:predicted 3-demethylubiquinone-9 3-methyltransferase (glyoxalase superfamily)
MPRITTFLSYVDKAEEAAKFYVSIFPNSRIKEVVHYQEGMPGPAGSVMIVNFELDGQEFVALNGGEHFKEKLTEGVSLLVNCDTQEEIDTYWQKLTEGGTEVQCGWLVDKFGVSWQVAPSHLERLMNDREPEATKRVMESFMPMKKLDLATMQRAHDSVPTR